MFRSLYKIIFRLQFQNAFFICNWQCILKTLQFFFYFLQIACYTDELNLDICQRLVLVRRQAAVLSPRGPGFDPRPLHMTSMVDKVALGQGFLLCHSTTTPYLPFSFFFAVALRPNAGHGLLILEVSRSHTRTDHSRQDSSGRVISQSQRPLPDNTQHSQQTNIYAPGGIRTHNLSRLVAADLRLRRRGHWDRHLYLNITIIWRTGGRSWGPLKKSSILSDIIESWT